jgi:hypothetical protein
MITLFQVVTYCFGWVSVQIRRRNPYLAWIARLYHRGLLDQKGMVNGKYVQFATSSKPS